MKSKFMSRLRVLPRRSFAAKPHTLGRTAKHPDFAINLTGKHQPINNGFTCTARYQGDMKDYQADQPILKGKWKVFIFGNWDVTYGRYGDYPASDFDQKAKQFEDHNAIVIFPYYEHGTHRNDMYLPLSRLGFQLEHTYIVDPDNVTRFVEPMTVLPNDMDSFLSALLKCQEQYKKGYID